MVRAQSPTSVRAGDSARVACRRHNRRLRRGRLRRGLGTPLRAARAGVRRAGASAHPARARAEGEPAVEDGAVTVKNPCLSGGALEIFLKPHLPAATLRVVGATPIAQALAELGRRLGYAVEQGPADRSRPARRRRGGRRRLARARRGADPHGGAARRRPLRRLWSPARSAATRSSSRSTSPRSSCARLHTPAGLEIGAETPEEIALSILAEIVALRPARRGRAPPAAGDRPSARRPPGRAAGRGFRRSPSRAPVGSGSRSRIDPVCGMEVALSPASIQLERDGERYYFCSEGCRDSFAAEGVPGAAVG